MPRNGVSLSVVVTVITLAFSAGAFIGQWRCHAEIDILRTRFEAHERIPIHPGAATSEVVKALEERVRSLERNSRRQP